MNNAIPPSRSRSASKGSSSRAQPPPPQFSAHHLRQFADALPIQVAEVDRELRYVFANAAHADLFGVTTDTIVGRTVREVLGDDSFATVGPHLYAALGRDVPSRQSFELRLPARDRVCHLEATYVPQRGEHGATGCIMSVVDVTERLRAEAATARLAAIMHFSGAAMIGVSQDRLIDSWNPAAERLFGYTAAEIVGKPVSILAPADRPDEPADIARRLRQGEVIYNLETVRVAKDGRRIDVLLTPAPILGSDGTMCGTSASLIDITERKAAEATNARLAAVVQFAGVAMAGVNQDGIVKSWNPAAERLFGYSAAELIGKPVTILTPEDRRHEPADIARRLRAGDVIASLETVRVAKDGRRIDVLLTPAPILSSDGEIKDIVVTLMDITERKKAEQTHQLLIDEINHRVKNTLNVLQAIAQQTLASAKNPAHFVESFVGRVQAMARAHSLLTRAKWEGADLTTLVREQVLLDAPNAIEDTRVTIGGPLVELERQAAVHLALVLHELGTNARKYGALSSPEGRLAVTWRVEADANATPVLELGWLESGVALAGERCTPGFGTKLIERSLAHAHGGHVNLRFAAGGVSCDISLPLRARSKASDQAGTHP